jgi:uncharacterized repeat protein (TIGR03803 family)
MRGPAAHRLRGETAMRTLIAGSACLAATLLSGLVASAAPSADEGTPFRRLHVFARDGAAPGGPLVEGADGFLYGTTTLDGGRAGGGALWRLAADGAVTTLHRFRDAPDDGATAQGALAQGADGSLFGTTLSGGARKLGTVFRCKPDGGCAVLHAFTGEDGDGANPVAGLVRARDGNFYGTTAAGGSGHGTVFRITPDGRTTILHAFRADAADEGNIPQSELVQGRDGALYGTTAIDGRGGGGTIFRLTLAGEYALLHDFANDAQGRGPSALIQASDGNFYGTTYGGGAHAWGTVFRMTPDGSLTTLHDFDLDGAGGVDPRSPLLDGGDGYLYGTTAKGGRAARACGGAGCGTVYRTTLGGAVSVVHSFDDRHPGNAPAAALIRTRGGHLVGTTSDLATAGFGGTVFSLGEPAR